MTAAATTLVWGSGSLAEALAGELRARGHEVERAEAPWPHAASAAPRLFVAASADDAHNLLAASLVRGAGAPRAVAVVSTEAPLTGSAAPDPAAWLRLDALVPADRALARWAEAQARAPAAAAIERFAAGRIRVRELGVAAQEAAGRSLAELALPPGVRLAAVRREGRPVPIAADTLLRLGDRVLLVANQPVADQAARALAPEGARPGIAVSGEGPVASLLRATLATDFDLASSPTEGAARFRVGADAVEFEPAAGAPSVRATAAAALADEIDWHTGNAPFRRLASLWSDDQSVFRVVAQGGAWVGAPLREIKGLRDGRWTILAIRASGRAYLPHPDDVIDDGETLLIAGPTAREPELHRGLRADA